MVNEIDDAYQCLMPFSLVHSLETEPHSIGSLALADMQHLC
jgi:hypothetical protein